MAGIGLCAHNKGCPFHLAAFSDKTEYDVLDALRDMGLPSEVYNPFYTFGLIILVSYAVISSILLGNLLIAIITNRYK